MELIYGEEDEFTFTAGNTRAALELLKDNTNASIINVSEFKLVPTADHSFHGTETEFAEMVSDWLAK